MILSRNNHYIPRMHLARWVNNERICVYRLLVSHDNVPIWSKQSLEHTGSLSNMYVNILKDQEYDDFEHDFDMRFESPAKKPLDKICNDEKMTSTDWKIVSDYVVAQYVRTPSFYIRVKDWGKVQIPEQLDALGEQLSELKAFPPVHTGPAEDASLLPIDVQISNEKPDESHTGIEISAISGKGLWLFAIKHSLADASALRKYFQNVKWSIITAPNEKYWPCCDNPVVICDIKENVIKKSDTLGGLAGKTKAIVIPISPKKLLLGMSSRKYTWRFQADSEQFEMIRVAIVNNAMLQVYSCIEDESITKIRPRVVDEKEYKRITEEFDHWFDRYKEMEGPLLRK